MTDATNNALNSQLDNAQVVKETDEARLARLAALPKIEYEKVRTAESKAMGIKVGTLDEEIKSRRPTESDAGMDFPVVVPSDSPVDPSVLLDDLVNTIRRFVVCEPETSIAAALWIAMTWVIDSVQVAPLAVITAPEKRCGKSMMLFLIGKLVPRALPASNISPSALFRAIDQWKPTLIIDEADAFMRDNEELRGILNCGHTRDTAYVVRTVGESFTPTKFNVWGAKAIAGIGRLADTLMDRSIVLELRRKLPNESVERIRHASPELFAELSSRLARFALDNADAISQARPRLPDDLNDRAQDNWESLLAIADIAGSQWSEKARAAALNKRESEDVASSSNELLSDIQTIFQRKEIEKISLKDLVDELCDDEEMGWKTYNYGKPVSIRQISKYLRAYGISSKAVRTERYGSPPKGYELAQFQDVFSRYLISPSAPSENSDFSVTSSQSSIHAGSSVTDCDRVTEQVVSVTNKNVTGIQGFSHTSQLVTRKPSTGAGRDRVTEKTAFWGDGEIEV